MKQLHISVSIGKILHIEMGFMGSKANNSLFIKQASFAVVYIFSCEDDVLDHHDCDFSYRSQCITFSWVYIEPSPHMDFIFLLKDIEFELEGSTLVLSLLAHPHNRLVMIENLQKIGRCIEALSEDFITALSPLKTSCIPLVKFSNLYTAKLNNWAVVKTVVRYLRQTRRYGLSIQNSKSIHT